VTTQDEVQVDDVVRFLDTIAADQDVGQDHSYPVLRQGAAVTVETDAGPTGLCPSAGTWEGTSPLARVARRLDGPHCLSTGLRLHLRAERETMVAGGPEGVLVRRPAEAATRTSSEW